MKYFLTFLMILSASTNYALTNITTPNVSGTWSLSGSPYIVQVPITVPAALSLTIQPGVEVRFMAATKLDVNGKLIAKGTSSSPIVFSANDTIGWSNQSVTTGGWGGIHIFQYQGSGVDSSKMEFCTIKDCKYGYSTYIADMCPFLASRKLKLINCNFTHNTCGTGMNTSGTVITLSTQSATDTIELDGCDVSENTSVFGVLRFENYQGGYTYIHRTRVHHNHECSSLWGSWFNALIENNEVDHNDMINDNAPIKMSIGTATIRFNKVHHNHCHQLAAIGCRSGKIDIDNNLICNNEQLDGNCGATGGGGGIHLAHNEGGANFADTYYRVRNNVIVNNYSAYGGGGIYVYHAKAEIMNNTIVNNSTALGSGNALLILDAMSEVKVKNNLFKGNSIPNWADSLKILSIYSCNTLLFDNNYIPGQFYQSVSGSYAQLLGDTSHNVIGNSPMLTAPTANSLVTTDATNANFNLQILSPCVDKGDTVGASCLPIDYLSNNRIMGPKIDIGAFEVIKSGESIFEQNQNKTSFHFYPNPALDLVQVSTILNKGVLQLFNVEGRILKSIDFHQSNFHFSVQDITPGIYFIRLTDGKQSTKTEKIMVD